MEEEDTDVPTGDQWNDKTFGREPRNTWFRDDQVSLSEVHGLNLEKVRVNCELDDKAPSNFVVAENVWGTTTSVPDVFPFLNDRGIFCQSQTKELITVMGQLSTLQRILPVQILGKPCRPANFTMRDIPNSVSRS